MSMLITLFFMMTKFHAFDQVNGLTGGVFFWSILEVDDYFFVKIYIPLYTCAYLLTKWTLNWFIDYCRQ